MLIVLLPVRGKQSTEQVRCFHLCLLLFLRKSKDLLGDCQLLLLERQQILPQNNLIYIFLLSNVFVIVGDDVVDALLFLIQSCLAVVVLFSFVFRQLEWRDQAVLHLFQVVN